MSTSYHTEQKKIIKGFFENNSEKAFSVDDVLKKINVDGQCVAKSSAYRIISKLSSEGYLKKIVDETTRECMYRRNAKNCNKHIHIKCVSCGKYIHLSDTDTKLAEGIMKKSGFSLDTEKTVLYGECENCKI